MAERYDFASYIQGVDQNPLVCARGARGGPCGRGRHIRRRRRGIRNDAPLYLSRLLTNKEAFFALFRFVPLFAAVLIGVSQFLPEVVDKRIKLSLHLPLGPVRVVYSMVLYGFLLLSAILACCLLLFVGLTAVYLPAEVIRAALVTMMPWVLGGMTAYFWIAMIARNRWKVPLFLFHRRLSADFGIHEKICCRQRGDAAAGARGSYGSFECLGALHGPSVQ